MREAIILCIHAVSTLIRLMSHPFVERLRPFGESA
jgi:hypothetical protein